MSPKIVPISRATYTETFDDGPGGWYGWNATGPTRLLVRDGAAIACGPWWVDFNHAPPGAGYLHILYALDMTQPDDPATPSHAAADRNRFVAGGHAHDLANAEIAVRLRGDVTLRGAQMVLLIQTQLPDTRVNMVLTGQPIQITPDWSEQTLRLVPDPQQWQNLGSRHDRTDMYGNGDIREALVDVNLDIIFVLFPLDVAPVGPIDGDPHRLRASVDYFVDPRRLPEGCVWLDRVEIRYPS